MSRDNICGTIDDPAMIPEWMSPRYDGISEELIVLLLLGEGMQLARLAFDSAANHQ